MRLGALVFMLFYGLAEANDSGKNDRVTSTQLYWGDTHVHTSFSPDASLNGNIRIGPEEAFRFARGQVIEGHNGKTAKLERPLDFLVVTDHAEYLGLLPRIRNKVPQSWKIESPVGGAT